ncbi:MAG: FAD-binding protein, partial [Dehalococcoidia bacterium]
MAQERNYDIVIIGSGPAGLAAGLYAARARRRSVLLERGVVGGQIALT